MAGDGKKLGGYNDQMSVIVPQAQIQSIRSKINRIAKERGATSPQTMTIFLLERAAVRLMADEKLLQGTQPIWTRRARIV